MFDNLAIVMVVAAVAPLVLAVLRSRLPGPVLEIVAGILIGPAALGMVETDELLRALSTLGLAFLLFLAGLEIDVERFRGDRARRALSGLVLTVVLGLASGAVLAAVGVVSDGLLIGIALMATSLGLVVPVLKDAGVSERPVGQLVIAGASCGEVTSIVLLSLLFSERGGPVGGRLLLLGLLAAVVAVLAAVVLRAESWAPLSRLVDSLADTTAQLRVRFAVLLLVGLATLASHLGLEAILGAFLAGLLLRIVDPDAMTRHPHLRFKLDGLGFGFLVPIFFVVSGVSFDLDALVDDPATLLRVPLFVALLLLVRGLPALAYRGELTRRETAAAGLLQASSLPFLVAATQIGVSVGAISSANAAALVAAGLVSVLVFPAAALRLLVAVAVPVPAPRAGAGDSRNVQQTTHH
jgi:Kef-type K+ transport system membrane component KefB